MSRGAAAIRATGPALGRVRRAAYGVLLAGLVGWLTVGHASAQGGDKALAESLFRDARTLMKRNKLDQACPKFAESYRLDPAVGTLLNLAVCHERQGRLATAWADYKDAVVEAKRVGQRERAQLAQQRANELEGKLSRATISVPDATAVLEGFELKLDGRVIGKAVWGSPIPLDSGEHYLEATAQGHQTYKSSFTVEKGGKTVSVELPELDPEAAKEPEPAPAPVKVEAEPTQTSPQRDELSDGSGQRLIGLLVGGVGFVGVGVGSYFGLSAISLKSDRDEECNAENVCSPEGKESDEDARSAATVSTISFIAGGALVAVGAVLYLSAPTAPDQARLQVGPTLTAGGAGLQLRGGF